MLHRLYSVTTGMSIASATLDDSDILRTPEILSAILCTGGPLFPSSFSRHHESQLRSSATASAPSPVDDVNCQQSQDPSPMEPGSDSFTDLMPPLFHGKRRNDHMELSPTDLARRRKRRERNKIAAIKCRNKKKTEMNVLLQESDVQITLYNNTRAEVLRLMDQRNQLMSTLSRHLNTCTSCPAAQRTARTLYRCNHSPPPSRPPRPLSPIIAFSPVAPPTPSPCSSSAGSDSVSLETWPQGTVAIATGLPSSCSVPTMLPNSCSMSTELPSSCSMSTVLPSSCSMSTVLPGSCSMSTVLPGSCSMSTVLPGSCSMSTELPSSCSMSTVLPSSCSMSTVLPSSFSMSTVLPGSCSKSTVLPGSCSKSTVLPGSCSMSTVLPSGVGGVGSSIPACSGTQARPGVRNTQQMHHVTRPRVTPTSQPPLQDRPELFPGFHQLNSALQLS